MYHSHSISFPHTHPTVISPSEWGGPCSALCSSPHSRLLSILRPTLSVSESLTNYQTGDCPSIIVSQFNRLMLKGGVWSRARVSYISFLVFTCSNCKATLGWPRETGELHPGNEVLRLGGNKIHCCCFQLAVTPLKNNRFSGSTLSGPPFLFSKGWTRSLLACRGAWCCLCRRGSFSIVSNTR